MQLIHLKEIASTNSYLAGIAMEAAHGTVVYADCQTAGRGQRGNSWESEPGKNLTMSILLHPETVLPSRQFLLSEISALAVVHVLERRISNVAIKWPNDIYYNDLKICGMLIEHSLSGGRINHTVSGIGLNINQRVFVSDAPNPVSLYMVTGREVSVELLCREISEELLRLYDTLPENAVGIHQKFLDKLYRREGFYEYQAMVHSVSTDGNSNLEKGKHFQARIKTVDANGILHLETEDGSEHLFAFKEVSFILPYQP